MLRRFFRSILVLAPLITTGCGTWKSAPLGLEPRRLPATSMIVVKSGERVEMTDGYIGRDSVVGFQARMRRAIPRDSVVSVEERVGTSSIPVVMLGMLAVGAAVLMLSSGLNMKTD